MSEPLPFETSAEQLERLSKAAGAPDRYLPNKFIVPDGAILEFYDDLGLEKPWVAAYLQSLEELYGKFQGIDGGRPCAEIRRLIADTHTIHSRPRYILRLIR